MPLRVLLVDDHADLRFLLRRALARDGRCEVVGEAADGRAGIEEAVRLRPDLIVLDLSMPVMDGLEALPHLKRRCPEARVVVMSGFARSRLGDTVLALGAEAYVEKGLHPWAIVEALLRASDAPRREAPATVELREALVERARALV